MAGPALAMAVWGVIGAGCGGGDPSPVTIPPSLPAGAAEAPPSAPEPPAPTTTAPVTPPPPAVAAGSCFGARSDGSIVTLDLATETTAPFAKVSPAAGQLESFGVRGRQLFTCSRAGRVARVDLDSGQIAEAEMGCEAVTADAKAIYALSSGALFVLPDFAEPKTAKPLAVDADFGTMALGVGAGGVLAPAFGEVLVVDPVTSARSFRKMEDVKLAVSITERNGELLVLDVQDQDSGVLTFDANGQRTRALFAKEGLVGVSCSR